MIKPTLALLALVVATHAQATRTASKPLTPPEQLPQAATHVEHFVMYDVGDLSPNTDFSPNAPGKTSAAAQMSEILRTWCEPSFVKPDAAVQPVGAKQVVVRGSQEQHTWVDAFLATQRTALDFITVRVKVAQVPRSSQAALGLDGHREVSSVTSAEAQRMIAQLPGLGGTLVTAPEITAWPRQRANISVLNQRSYVESWSEHRVEPNDTLVAEPHIETINDGISLDVRPTPLSGEKIGITLGLELIDLEALDTHTVTLPLSGDERDISLPTIGKVTANTQVSLSQGMTAVLHTAGSSAAFGGQPDESQILVVFIDVTSM